jgi:hypothetical protein
MKKERSLFYQVSLLIMWALLGILLAVMIEKAFAQQSTHYGIDGRVIGRSQKDSQGTTTLYGPDGRPALRQSGTTIYDARTGKAIEKTEPTYPQKRR